MFSRGEEIIIPFENYGNDIRMTAHINGAKIQDDQLGETKSLFMEEEKTLFLISEEGTGHKQ